RKKSAKAKNAGKKAASTSKKSAASKKQAKRARSPKSDSQPEVDQNAETMRPKKRAKNAPVGLASGKFDLYAMELPFLASVYLPPGQSASAPRFGALYDKILEYQAKPDSTAQCVIPAVPFKGIPEDQKRGRLESAVFEDPMEQAPWAIALVDLQAVPALDFPLAERKQFATPPQTDCGPGIEGRTALAEGHCGVQRAGGVFRMQRAWGGERAGNAVELWEGYLSFDVVYSGMYRRKGNGNGESIGFPFWGVRARKDADGKEIGLNDGT
ncbi:hypothetical protein B0H12DRAFT_1008888, partial [Mycena haematopus]